MPRELIPREGNSVPLSPPFLCLGWAEGTVLDDGRGCKQGEMQMMCGEM